jgi:hypothetical protein
MSRRLGWAAVAVCAVAAISVLVLKVSVGVVGFTRPDRSKVIRYLPGTDCPDGLARCDDGTVKASRLAVLPAGCRTADGPCRCPWDVLGSCRAGCVAEGAELVIEPSLALAQLCTPQPDAGALVSLPRALGLAPSDERPERDRSCEEGEAFRCVGGDIVSCSERRTVASCVHGCYRDEAAVEDDTNLSREQAYALLCSR